MSIKAEPAETLQAPAVAVRHMKTKGRAVIALINIPKHSVILQSHAVLVSKEDSMKLGDTGLWPYRFALGDQCAFVFGEMSFCNHSDTPNAAISWTQLTPASAVASLIALTDISANSEIEIFYADAEEYHRRGVALS
jgi:hypothetical protein